jgi:hypothetical protein
MFVAETHRTFQLSSVRQRGSTLQQAGPQEAQVGQPMDQPVQ